MHAHAHSHAYTRTHTRFMTPPSRPFTQYSIVTLTQVNGAIRSVCESPGAQPSRWTSSVGLTTWPDDGHLDSASLLLLGRRLSAAMRVLLHAQSVECQCSSASPLQQQHPASSMQKAPSAELAKVAAAAAAAAPASEPESTLGCACAAQAYAEREGGNGRGLCMSRQCQCQCQSVDSTQVCGCVGCPVGCPASLSIFRTFQRDATLP